jgi:hypothetical protein
LRIVISCRIVVVLITVLCFSVRANGQANQIADDDVKSVSDKINKSLTELTGTNSSELLKSTMASINNTAQQLADQSKGIINEGSLDTTESIAKKSLLALLMSLVTLAGKLNREYRTNKAANISRSAGREIIG